MELSRAAGSQELHNHIGPAKILAGSSMNSAVVFQHESRLWLAAIRQRLCSRRSVALEISRDIPYELFIILRKVVKSMPCFGSNTEGEVISFTNLRLVVELLALLSGYTKDEVAT